MKSSWMLSLATFDRLLVNGCTAALLLHCTQSVRMYTTTPATRLGESPMQIIIDVRQYYAKFTSVIYASTIWRESNANHNRRSAALAIFSFRYIYPCHIWNWQDSSAIIIDVQQHLLYIDNFQLYILAGGQNCHVAS